MMLKENTKKYVWTGLRISFWIMVIIWAGEIIFLPEEMSSEAYWTGYMSIVSLLFIASGIYTFIASIIHLIKYKEKAFALVSLVISSVLILIFLIGVIVVAISLIV